jgi:hypothetical protein
MKVREHYEGNNFVLGAKIRIQTEDAEIGSEVGQICAHHVFVVLPRVFHAPECTPTMAGCRSHAPLPSLASL